MRRINAPTDGARFRLRRGVGTILMILVVALPWAMAADELTQDERLAIHYLSDYFLLEGASPLRDYTRAEFLKPHPEEFLLFRPGPFRGMYLFTRVDTPTAEFGIGNVSLGPISFSGSVSTRSLGAPRDTSAYPYIEWSESDDLRNRVLVAPRLGVGGAIRLWDVAEVEFRHTERSFYRTTVIDNTIVNPSPNYDTSYELPPEVHSQSSDAFSARLYPAAMFPRTSVLSQMPVISWVFLTEGFKPAGLMNTYLFDSERWLSKVFLQFGRSEVPGIRYAQLSSYLLVDILLAELEYDTLEDSWIHDDWRFRRARVGLDMITMLRLGIFGSEEIRNWFEVARIYSERDNPFVLGWYLTHEWRNVRPELVPGGTDSISQAAFGSSLQVMMRIARFDLVVRWDEVFEWVGPSRAPLGITAIDNPSLPPTPFSLEFRYRFNSWGANR